MTITRPQSLGVYADRSRPADTRRPASIISGGAAHGDALAAILGIETPTLAVTERTVTGLPAVSAAVEMVANGVATMMTSAAAFDADDYELPAAPIVERPFVMLGSFEFWHQAVTCVMQHGNYVGVLADFDPAGWAQQVVPVHPSAVSCDTSSGVPVYRIAGTVYRWDEVVHVRHSAPVGSLWGQGIIERYRTALRGQVAQQRYGTDSFSSAGVPSAVIALDADFVPEDVLERTQERWMERTAGGQRKPAVLPRTISVTPLAWSPHDAEFAESRRISVAEAALMAGLAPSDLEASIGTGSGLTYANLTDRSLARIVQSFSPWMARFEQAWSDLLPPGQRVRGNPEALLRSTTRERFELFRIGKELGIYTPAELREIEHRPTRTTTDTEENDQ